MLETSEIIEHYLAAWNTVNVGERASAMQKIIAEDCYYADAHLPEPLIGREVHDRFITQFRDKFPEFSLKLAAPVQSHHGYFRFGWELLKPDGAIFVKGVYFGTVDNVGKINRIIGFVD